LSAYWDIYNWSYLEWYKLSDDEIRSLLLEVEGIGSKTVEMILLYTFQRPDIFPIEDLQLKNVMKKVYEIDDKEDLESEMIYISDDWKPFRSTAVLYLLETAKTMKI
jgi:DNA-3-methyladenine glycosylase II